MQHRQAGEHMARAVRDLCRVGGQPEGSLRIPLAVELDEALAEQGKALRCPVTPEACGVSGAVEVRVCGGVVSALRRVPNQLTHQRCALGLGGMELPPHQTRRRLCAQERNLAEALSRFRKERNLFDEYVRRSDLKDATPQAVDISEIELARRIVAAEQDRLGVDSTEAVS